MDELIQSVVGKVNQAGGTMPYADVLASLDRADVPGLPRALKAAQGRGVLHQQVRWDAAAKKAYHEVIAGRRGG